jgi:hypothetical protein
MMFGIVYLQTLPRRSIRCGRVVNAHATAPPNANDYALQQA